MITPRVEEKVQLLKSGDLEVSHHKFSEHSHNSPDRSPTKHSKILYGSLASN